MNDITTTHLPNGTHIITRTLPNARSAALGVWIVNGGRHQHADQCGYAHLLEHLLFKGSQRHSALELAQRFEAMGGQVNAHTGRELTALHGVVPGEHLPALLELFGAMLLEPGFTGHDLDIERDIVFQEMAMIEDTPEEALEEDGVRRAWWGHAAGWPILGARDVLEQSRAPALHAYLRDVLCGARLFVVAVGAVRHEELVAACAPFAALPAGALPEGVAPRFTPGSAQARRSVTQAHLLWIMPAPPLGSAEYVTALVANHVLGGGTSSRLFQEIRERHGLAYGIHSRLEQYSDCGLWLIQTACEAERVGQCRAAVEQVLGELGGKGPSEKEVAQARAHLHAALLIDEDNAEAGMERLAREGIYLRRHPTVEDRVQELEAVGVDGVRELLAGAWGERQVVEWLPE